MKKVKRDVFQVIADPTRRAIIALIAINAMTPGAIAEHFKTTRQAVSKHIKVLVESEIVKQEIKGREIYYHFDPYKIKEVVDFTEPFRKIWDDRFNKLESVMKKYKERT